MSNAAKKNPQQGRRHIRFNADANTLAVVALKGAKPGDDHVALVLSESYFGCGLVMISNIKLKIGDVCYVQVGRMAPLEAEARWLKELDEGVLSVGFQFLEEKQ